MGNLSEHFDRHEFACSHCGKALVQPHLLTILELVRKAADFPFHINSGYRCPEYNASLKDSVPDSAHTKGLAVDVSCVDGERRFRLVEAALTQGIRRIGIARTFVHLDVAQDMPGPRIWLYR